MAILSNPPDNPTSTVAVAVTAGDPDREPLGWRRFAALVGAARQHGGQGVAVMHSLWTLFG